MKNLLTLPLLLLYFVFPAKSQFNALDFDGIDDNAIAAGASSLIANSNQISMAFWVYPTNAAPTYPNFDGFLGFRDNLFADFYILQLSANGIEARFRNSSGVNYDISYNGLILNTWQHFAFVYDGSSIKLYQNAVLKQTVSASGSITNTGASFYLGNLVYQTTNFWFDGKLDDVGLWKKALTQTEVSDIFGCGAEQAPTELKLHYKLDQGIPGGSNPGLNTITDAKGNINASMTGFALSGSSSNWVSGVSLAMAYPQSATICNGDSFLFAGQYYKTAGTYNHIYPGSGPCDSMVVLTLIVKPSYHFPGYANLCMGDSLLWLGQYLSTGGVHTRNFVSGFGCDSIYSITITMVPKPVNFAISGPSTCLIGQSYTYTVPSSTSAYYFWNIEGGQILSASGSSADVRWNSYGAAKLKAVALDSYGCRSDTAVALVWVGQSGIEEVGSSIVRIYPNPVVNGLMSVELNVEGFFNWEIIDVTGRRVLSGAMSRSNLFDVSELRGGLYLFRVIGGGISATRFFVK
jgi:hypothetical protein